MSIGAKDFLDLTVFKQIQGAIQQKDSSQLTPENYERLRILLTSSKEFIQNNPKKLLIKRMKQTVMCLQLGVDWMNERPEFIEKYEHSIQIYREQIAILMEKLSNLGVLVDVESPLLSIASFFEEEAQSRLWKRSLLGSYYQFRAYYYREQVKPEEIVIRLKEEEVKEGGVPQLRHRRNVDDDLVVPGVAFAPGVEPSVKTSSWYSAALSVASNLSSLFYTPTQKPEEKKLLNNNQINNP